MNHNPKKGHYLIIALILVLNLFWLPVISAQKNNDSKKSPSQVFTSLASYEPPRTAVVNPTSRPQLSTNYFLVLDSDTNKILLENNATARIYPASTTKLATALTALNVFPLEEVVTVNQEYSQGKVMDLKVGEKITVRSLVSALLVYSANDAAFNLASHHPGGITGFVDEMNQVVKRNGLKSTHFSNYDGIHADNHYSTLYDLSQLGRAAIKMETIRELVRLTQITVSDTDNLYQHQLVSTNELLGVVAEVEGLKTGWTPEAGGCFVGLVNINGHRLITVIAQSDDRFGDTRKLIDWANQNVSWIAYSSN